MLQQSFVLDDAAITFRRPVARPITYSFFKKRIGCRFAGHTGLFREGADVVDIGEMPFHRMFSSLCVARADSLKNNLMPYVRNSTAGGGLMGQLPDMFGAFERELQNGEQ